MRVPPMLCRKEHSMGAASCFSRPQRSLSPTLSMDFREPRVVGGGGWGVALEL